MAARPCSSVGCDAMTDRVHGYCTGCVSAFAEESRLEQGLSPYIDDPVVLDQLAAALLASAPRSER